VEDDGLQKAQAAVVLGGDGNGSRILKAAEIAQAGYVPLVLVDGPKSLLGHESDETVQYAELRGYPASLFRAIPLGDDIRSTRAEAQYVGKYLKTQRIRKILLVTSNYHTRRAAYWFRKEDPWLQVIAIPAADPEFVPNSWWTYREGQKTFVLEWLKTVTERWFGVGV
jgi:uncharacterized SAM-binding protein YcdF (DUF218 family)